MPENNLAKGCPILALTTYSKAHFVKPKFAHDFCTQTDVSLNLRLFHPVYQELMVKKHNFLFAKLSMQSAFEAAQLCLSEFGLYFIATMKYFQKIFLAYTRFGQELSVYPNYFSIQRILVWVYCRTSSSLLKSLNS